MSESDADQAHCDRLFTRQQAELCETPLRYRMAWNTMTSVKSRPSICQA
jgi:hypothetical protein